MAISTTYAWTLTRDQVIRQAYRLCGILPVGKEPNANQISSASDMLNAISRSLANDGVILRTVERTTVTTTAATATYTAAADTIDVEFPGYVTQTSGSNINTSLEPMSRDEYMALTDKTMAGLPTRMYVEKATTAISLILWPVPDASITSFTYQRIRMSRDLDSGSVNVDIGTNWLKAITYMLAHDVALENSLPMQKVSYLKGLAESELKKSEGNDTERGDVQLFVDMGR